MNWLDIIILVFVAGITFVGLKIGLIKTVLSLAGIIIGVVLAGRFYASVAKILTFISQENIANIVAFAIILIVVIIIASVLAVLLKWIAKVTLLGWVNHLGGAVFGFVMGTIFCAAILALWAKYAGTPDILRESLLAGILLDRFPAVLGLLPKEFDAIRSFFQ
jgi:membrane protein required for colicin V production